MRRDKYGDDATADLQADIARLHAGEPLAYVIGWIPFLGLRIYLDSHPLIPRPETEWWTEKLITHLKDTFGDAPFSLLDLCSGSGAIGLSILNEFPNARVTFGEIDKDHGALIKKNIDANSLDASRALVCASDLFSGLPEGPYDVIATNPPYIPENRELDLSVREFEPARALFSGADGLTLIERIAKEAPRHLKSGGELWLECDSEHADEARGLFGEHAQLHNDQYGRPRLVVSYY